MKIDISDTDLFLMLGSSMRYCMGRRSYIVGSSAEWFTKYAPKLSEINKTKIINEANILLKEQSGRMALFDVRAWEEAIEKVTQ